MFAFRIGNLRAAFKQLGPASALLPPWQRILLVAFALAIFAGAIALVLNMVGIHDPAMPTSDYTLAATIPLSERDYQGETVTAFTLAETGDAAILLRVERLNTPFIDVSIYPSQGDSIQLLHGEWFSTDVNASQAQYRLPAGENKIVLTSLKSPGLLKVYLRLP